MNGFVRIEVVEPKRSTIVVTPPPVAHVIVEGLGSGAPPGAACDLNVDLVAIYRLART